MLDGWMENALINEPATAVEDRYREILRANRARDAAAGRTLDGPHTMVSVNGVKVTDYTEGDPVPPMKYDFEPKRGPRPDEGYMGLQNHSKDDVVFFKEVAIKSLKK